MNIIKHWLHGDRKFKVAMTEDTPCRKCVHSLVCSKDVVVRCSNFEWSCSGEKGCQSCKHSYTRFEPTQPIPCFHCSLFKQRKGTKWFSVWARHTDETNWWGQGLCKADEQKEVEHRLRSPDNDETEFLGPDCLIEFVPLTELEYEYLLQKQKQKEKDDEQANSER